MPRGDLKDLVRAVAVESGPLDRGVRVTSTAAAAPVKGGGLAAVGDEEGAALVRDREADD